MSDEIIDNININTVSDDSLQIKLSDISTDIALETSLAITSPNITSQLLNTKAILESLLFINDTPLELKDLSEITGVEKKELELILEELINDYTQRNSGIRIIKIAGGYQMFTAPDLEVWVKKFYQHKRKKSLSMPALETLSIVAYKQPITKLEIENIRGVNSDGVISNLFDLGLIKVGGKKEVVGRPFVYVTTGLFLEYFGLNNLKDLPKLEEFASFVSNNVEIIEENKEDNTKEPINEINETIDKEKELVINT